MNTLDVVLLILGVLFFGALTLRTEVYTRRRDGYVWPHGYQPTHGPKNPVPPKSPSATIPVARVESGPVPTSVPAAGVRVRR